MTVVIRMKRTGRKNRPCYRISVADQRAPRDGTTLENLGLYDPIAPRPEARLTLDVERAKHWLSVGAQPSETVRSIFKRQGVYAGAAPKPKRDRSGRKKKTKTGERRAAAKRARAERKAQRAKA
jgi:small subunit ribosomal protein S16